MSPWVDSLWCVQGVKYVLLVVCEAFLSVLTVYTHCSCVHWAVQKHCAGCFQVYGVIRILVCTEPHPLVHLCGYQAVFSQSVNLSTHHLHIVPKCIMLGTLPLLILNIYVASCLEVGAVTSLSSTEWHFEYWYSLNYASNFGSYLTKNTVHAHYSSPVSVMEVGDSLLWD
jgi:hypothetical protein